MERMTFGKIGGSRRSLFVAAVGVVAALGLVCASARAEEGAGVAGSGMEQGSGAITTRNDVTLSVESLPGTSALRLGAIGEAIGTQMTAIRACYSDVTEARPTVQGNLDVRLNIAEGRRGRATLEIAQNTTGDQALVDCVLGAIQRAPLMNVRGPAGGLIVFRA